MEISNKELEKIEKSRWTLKVDAGELFVKAEEINRQKAKFQICCSMYDSEAELQAAVYHVEGLLSSLQSCEFIQYDNVGRKLKTIAFDKCTLQYKVEDCNSLGKFYHCVIEKIETPTEAMIKNVDDTVDYLFEKFKQIPNLLSYKWEAFDYQVALKQNTEYLEVANQETVTISLAIFIDVKMANMWGEINIDADPDSVIYKVAEYSDFDPIDDNLELANNINAFLTELGEIYRIIYGMRDGRNWHSVCDQIAQLLWANIVSYLEAKNGTE